MFLAAVLRGWKGRICGFQWRIARGFYQRTQKDTGWEFFFVYGTLNTNEKRDTLFPTVGETSEQCIWWKRNTTVLWNAWKTLNVLNCKRKSLYLVFRDIFEITSIFTSQFLRYVAQQAMGRKLHLKVMRLISDRQCLKDNLNLGTSCRMTSTIQYHFHNVLEITKYSVWPKITQVSVNIV